MKYGLIGLALPVLVSLGCATGRHLATDRSDPNYQQGRYSAQSPISAGGQEGPVTAAIAGAILSPGYYSKTEIKGHLSRINPGDPMPLPCSNCSVILIPMTEADAVRGQANADGDFAVHLKPGVRYRLEPASKKLRVRDGKTQDITAGEELLLTFEPLD